MSLTDKILSLTKNNVYASVFSDSELLKRKTEYAPTNVPMLNVALSGKWEGGLSSGITILAGPSRNGKTYIGLILVKAYLEKYPDAVCVFLDSELGASKMYFDRLGIDTARIIHIPLTNIEEAKFQCVKIFEGLSTNDHCMFFFDSIGNLASKKELDDAQNEKSVADMSRAKQLKSFFRIITPYVNLKNVPFVGINHTYQTTDFFPQEVMGGGCLEGSTLIKTEQGLKEIKNIFVGEKVLTKNGYNEVEHVFTPDELGVKECYKITFEDGLEVICSAEHKFLVENEWKCLLDLKEGINCDIIQ